MANPIVLISRGALMADTTGIPVSAQCMQTVCMQNRHSGFTYVKRVPYWR